VTMTSSDNDSGTLNRLKLGLQYYHWLLMSALVLLTLALGYWGFRLQGLSTGEQQPPLNILYAALQLFIMESGGMSGPITWQLQIARFLAPGIAAYAAIRALWVLFREQRQLLSLCFIKNHVVICGLGKRGFYLARAVRRDGLKVIVIEKDAENDNLAYCRSHGIVTLVGDCTEAWLLKKARALRARWLVAVCGDDGTNAEVAAMARRIGGDDNSTKLTCHVHIIDSELCHLLRERQIRGSDTSPVRIEFFNIFDTGASALLKKFPLPSQFSDDKGDHAHMLIVGMGQLGRNLVINVIRQWQALHVKNSRNLMVTVLDRRANKLVEDLKLRYPRISEFSFVVPCEMDVCDPEFMKGDFLRSVDGLPPSGVYVTLDDDSLGLSTGITLRRRLDELGTETRVVVRMAEGTGLATLLPGAGIHEEAGPSTDDETEGLHAFCLLDEVCTPDTIVGGVREVIARAIHEDYVAGEIAKGKTPRTNPSMAPWDDLPEVLREANRAKADHLTQELKAFGYTIVSLTDWDSDTFTFPPEKLEAMAREEHQRWCEEKREAGFKYAPGEKTGKTHPDLVSYDDLSEEAKEKDRNMVQGIPKFLLKAGFQVKPTGIDRDL